MPDRAPFGSSRDPRPAFRPRSQARVRYYKASLALAFVFLALVLVLPLWMDALRHADDRSALKQPLESRAVLSGSEALPRTTDIPPASKSSIPQSDAVNTDCRGYVYGRCNTLRIGPRECVTIAAEAITVPIEGGPEACRAVVDPLLEARIESGGSASAVQASGASTPTEAAANGLPPQDAEASPENDAASKDGKPAPEAPTAAPEADAETTGSVQTTKAPTPPADGTPPQPALTPKERASALSRMQTLIDEFQRANYNYATPPAQQSARIRELRALSESVGTDEARALYNRLLEAHRTPPTRAPVAPGPGGYVGDAPRVEAGITVRSPTTTPELDAVGTWLDDARREAGLPATPAAAAPDQALPPMTTVGSERPSGGIESVPPAAAGFVDSVRP